MASENETIADIVAEMRSNEFDDPSFNVYSLVAARTLARGWADRIEAAHQLEVAELRECLREAVTEVCNRLEKCGFKEPCVFKTCYVQKWRKALQDEGGEKWMV